MGNKRQIALVVGLAIVLVGMSFATVPIGAEDNGNGTTILPPSVTKGVSPDTIIFGSIESQTTVTIEVTGDGGTSASAIPMDVVFSIDSSGSMGWNDPSNLRLTAAKDFVDNMNSLVDQGGVVGWDTSVYPTYGLSSDFTTLKSQIDLVNAGGGTNLNVGLNAAIAMLDANPRLLTDPSAEAIIFLTDGQGTYTWSGNPGSPADDAASKGYVIYSIGLGPAASGPLVDMATVTGGAYYSSATAANLQAIYDAIYSEILTSTVPHFVDVTEVTESYIVGHDNFNIAPDGVTTALDGTTTIIWSNVAQYVGDLDDGLDAGEMVTLTFTVGADKAGYELPVQVLPDAHIEYSDSEDNYVGSVPIPQAYLNVMQAANLIADGGDEYLDVGDVIIWQDDEYLYVKYVTTDGWYMTETHLDVKLDPNDIPQNKKGNPKIGHFDINEEHAPTQDVTYMIPWDEDWPDAPTLYIAAHAVVQKEIGTDEFGDPIYRGETAWGEGPGFSGNSWAMYIVYVDP